MKEQIEALQKEVNQYLLQAAKKEILKDAGIPIEQIDKLSTSLVSKEDIYKTIFERLDTLASVEETVSGEEKTTRLDFGKVEVDEEVIKAIFTQLEQLQKSVDTTDKKNEQSLTSLNESVAVLKEDRKERLFQLEDQIYLLENPSLKTVYQATHLKLSRLFLGLAVLNSGLVKGAENKMDKIAKWLSLGGAFIDVPFVPAAIDFVLEVSCTIYGKYKDQQLEKATSAVIDLYSMERLAERVARQLSMACAESDFIETLTPKGIAKLVDYFYQGIFESLKHIKKGSIEPTKNAFIEMALSHGSNKQDIETTDPKGKLSSKAIFDLLAKQLSIAQQHEHETSISYSSESATRDTKIPDLISVEPPKASLDTTSQSTTIDQTSEINMLKQKVNTLEYKVESLESELSKLNNTIQELLKKKEEKKKRHLLSGIIHEPKDDKGLLPPHSSTTYKL